MITAPIHIMLDLETWGTDPGCDIRSIGACVFDPLTATIGATFYMATDNPVGIWRNGEFHVGEVIGKERLKYIDLTRDPKTVKWWSDQSDEAQSAFADPIDLAVALDAFGRWLYHDVVGTDHFEEYGLTGFKLWSHGPAFDPPILAAAYRAVGLPVPWNYRTPRDTRTAFDMAGIHDDDDGSYRTFMTAYNTGTYHHALDDAIAQARSVCGAYQVAGMTRQPISDDPWITEILKLNASFAPTARDEQIIFHHLTVGDIRRIAPLFIGRAIENIADPSSLTPAENAIRDATLEQAASVCEGITSWGLPPTKLEVADSTKAFCAKVIRAQKSDSPERIAHEGKTDTLDLTDEMRAPDA